MENKINRGNDIGEPTRGIKGSLGDTLRNVDVRQSVEKVRGYAQSNPGKVLGGLAALVIGAGLMRRRGSMR
jgi:hypothetical protein